MVVVDSCDSSTVLKKVADSCGSSTVLKEWNVLVRRGC